MRNKTKKLLSIFITVYFLIFCTFSNVFAEETVTPLDKPDEKVSEVQTDISTELNTTPIAVSTAEQLKNVAYGGSYYLTNDINLSSTSWVPLSVYSEFALDGRGYKITNLYVPESAGILDAGLFAEVAANATIKNLGLENVNITGKYSGYSPSAAGFIAYFNGGTLIMENCYVTGTISSKASGYDSQSYAGGLVGYLLCNSATIKNCYSTAAASATGSYYSQAGGLVGEVSSDSYNINLQNSYAAGRVSATGAYSSVSTAGLIGYAYSTNVNRISISSCYFDRTVTNQYYAVRDFTYIATTAGKTTTQMKQSSTYINWDFTNIWDISSSKNSGYPFLRTQNSSSNNYTFAIQAGTGGSVNSSSNGSYPQGAKIAISATANTGYRFSNWTSSNGGTFDSTTSSSTNFTMPAGNTTVTANFQSTATGTTYTLTLQAGSGGSVNTSANGQYASGASIKIDATPFSGYTFKNWTSSSGGSFSSSTSASTYFTMPSQAATITANFQAQSTSGGDGATIVTTAPYSGKYLVAYNASTSVSSTSTTGRLALEDEIDNYLLEESPAEELPENTRAIVEIDGEILYEKEFQDNFEIPKDVNRMDLLYEEIEPSIEYAVGDVYTFYSIDDYRNSLYSLQAKYAYSGSYCDVYVERTSGSYKLTDSQASQVGQEFDNKIRGFMFNNFGPYLSNTASGANGLNGKIVILLEDIRDDYYYGYGNSYIAGYFYGADLLSSGQMYATGNSKSMIHIDINPLMRSGSSYIVSSAYPTLIHEFQHLINYTDYFKSPNQIANNESWWNEAFSMAAMHSVYGPNTNYITTFNNDSGSVVRNGAVLNYANYSDNNGSLAANYGLSYLFGQYLRTQTKSLPGGGDGIFKTILSSDKGNYEAIMEGLSKTGYSVTSFPELNRNLRIALVLKNSTGLYGFQGESAFNSVNYPLYSSTSALTLKGGAAIVKSISTPFTPSGAGTNTRFAGFQAGASQPATKYAITVTAGTGGTVNTSGGQLESNTSINLVATPNNNYQFKNWNSSNGGTFGSTTSASTTFRTPANATTVTAVFEATSNNRKISSLIVNAPKSFTASQLCDAITSTDGSVQKYSVVRFNGSSDVTVTGSLSQTETYYFKVVSASGIATEYYKINLY